MKMQQATSCVQHTRYQDKDGYGFCKVNGKTTRLHRQVYCQYNNVTLESIAGLLVRHSCDNTRCINPEHLLIGTAQDNMDDKVLRDRQNKGTTHGMVKLTPEEVEYIRLNCKPRDPINSVKSLSRRFGVSTTAIRYARDGRNWKHLTSTSEYAR